MSGTSNLLEEAGDSADTRKCRSLRVASLQAGQGRGGGWGYSSRSGRASVLAFDSLRVKAVWSEG